MREIWIQAASGKSRVVVGDGLPSIESYCGGVRPVVVTCEPLAKLYPKPLAGLDVITVRDGEAAKDIETVSRLYDEFCGRKLERGSFVVSFGGGVLSDLAGFAASTYLRGVRFGAVATSLLAQVDASIGGKNGVNFKNFKNLIGTIRQPEFCLCDTAYLRTLPSRELHCGFAEVIKHAAIASAELFNRLEQHSDKALSLESNVITPIVYDSIAIKAGIVQRDETEQGERRLLNFGHTIGHAIEGRYKIPHGHAVAVGMRLAGEVSVKRGLLQKADLSRLVRLIETYKLPSTYPYAPSEIAEGLERDKKRSGDSIRMVLLEAIGRSRIELIPIGEIREVLHELA